MKKASTPAVTSAFVLCFVFWMLVTGQIIDIFRGRASAEVIIAGIAVSVIAALFSARFFIHEDAWHLLKPARLGAFLKFCLIVFPAELIKANLDMVRRELSPKPLIKPGIVKIPVDMQSEYGQAMLANAITLTPGTITMDIAEDIGTPDADETSGSPDRKPQLYYYIHWIDVQTEEPAEAGQAIKGRMENALRRVWE